MIILWATSCPDYTRFNRLKIGEKSLIIKFRFTFWASYIEQQFFWHSQAHGHSAFQDSCV
jgi:hypothetical protein